MWVRICIAFIAMGMVAVLDGAPQAGNSGVAATQAATTRAVAKGSQRVLFVLDATFRIDTEDAHAEILKAAAELRAIDRVNVVVATGNRIAWAMQTEANPTERGLDTLQRGLKGLSVCYIGYGRGIRALVAALQRRPDVVWYITDGDLDPKVADEHLEAIRRANAGLGARINTTLRFGGRTPRAK